MKKILIATDGSAPAAEAVEVGLDLALQEGAEAVVVHVIPALDTVLTGGFGLATGALPHVVTEADRAPLVAAEALASELGVAATTTLLRGTTVSQIVAYADELDADLIVVGSRGHGALTTALLGSVSLGVLRHTTRPVMIVRPQVAPHVETPPELLAV
jgi:nucleotide-binding universal stress UspA family protein